MNDGSSYIRGTSRPHNPAEDQGISLAGFGIPSNAINEWNALQEALLNAPRTPCTTAPNDWTNPRGNAALRAVQGCMECPVKDLCRTYAEKAGETGVWGGRVL